MNNRLLALINLAKTDGEIDATEEALILKIGRAHGLSDEEVEQEMARGIAKFDFGRLSSEERFDTLYNLVHLMKVDGKIFDEEITYCLNMAKKLGFPMAAVMDLYSLVHTNVKLTSEINNVRRKYE